MKPQGHADVREALAIGDGRDPCTAPPWLQREREILFRPLAQNDARVALVAIEDDPTRLNGIDAYVLPVRPLSQGRPEFPGVNLIGEFLANAEAGQDSGIALSATPGLLLALQDYKDGRGRFYLHEGYIKVGYRRVELTFGRVGLSVGSPAHGSLFLSRATKPLNLWKLTLRPSASAQLMSAFSIDTWLADQGALSGVAGSKLWGISVGARPFPFVEVTVVQLYQFGGVGSPSLDGNDLLSMLAYSGDPALDSKRQRSLGIDVGIWGPSNFVKLYGQAFFDRITSSDRWLSSEMATLVGVWFPKLGEGEARLEYVHVPAGVYTHSYWTQGFTVQGTPLGHPVGPDGEGVYLDIGLPVSQDWRPGISFEYTTRGKSLSGTTRPEVRYGFGLELRRRWEQTELLAEGGYTSVRDKGYQVGPVANAFSTSALLRYSFF